MSTLISWSDETWNPTTGCDRVSPGCANCYAMQLAARFRTNPQMQANGIYQRDGGRASGPGFGLTLRPEVLKKPLHWRAPRRVFVNSMSDLFHEEIPGDYIDRVFSIMAQCPRHTFQILTKRIERAFRYLMQRDELGRWGWIDFNLKAHGADIPSLGYSVKPGALNPEIPWPLPNVLIGPTVENQRMADRRLPVLSQIHAFGWRTMVSYEPALGPVDFSAFTETRCRNCGGRFTGDYPFMGHLKRTCYESDLQRSSIDWLICGGESGPGRRPFDYAWAETALEQAKLAGIPFFMKQDGAFKSEQYDSLPDFLKVREFPA